MGNSFKEFFMSLIIQKHIWMHQNKLILIIQKHIWMTQYMSLIIEKHIWITQYMDDAIGKIASK